MSKFSEKGYFVKENQPIYFTTDMDKTAKWFEEVLGWYNNIVERDNADKGRYGVVFDMLPEVERVHLVPFTGFQMFYGEPKKSVISFISVASGVRRIEAVTGNAFMRLVDEKNLMIRKAADSLKANPADLGDKIADMLTEAKELRQKIDQLKDKILSGDVERFLFAAKNVGDLHIITTTRPDMEANDLRKMGDFLRDKDPKVVAVIATFKESKVTLAAFCGKEAVAAGVKAGDIIKTIAPVVGGKGGGKPDSAMGGGSEVMKIDDALAMVDDFVASKLG